MKLGVLAATLALVAGGAVACGGDDGDGGSEDKTASKKEFCDAFQAFYDDVISSPSDGEELGKTLKAAAKKIRDVGVPDGIPDDAEDGLDATLDAIDDLPDDATTEDIQEFNQNLDEDTQKDAQAFSDYLEKTCPDLSVGS